MRPSRFVLASALTLAGLSALVAAAPQSAPSTLSAATPGAATMPVDEIRPGMVAIGRTVFDGTRVEEFKAHILGVLENVIGTHRNLILARLEGGPLANTGVIAGMSGSPVYIDGRLVGAVSYALGEFSKEPIAGITPIAEMKDATSFGGGVRPPGSRVQLDLPLTRENLTTALRKSLAWNRPFASRPEDAALEGVRAVGGLAAGQLATELRPIATPLVMSGFNPELADLFGSAFSTQGFVPSGGGVAGARPGEMPFEGPLKPGDAIGVMLVNGDLQMGGTGTVTAIDGNRVYAFGHPLYNLGPTEFPMTRAYVYTVLPSLFSSIKLSTTGDVIGTFQQDRATAIAGTLGPGPRMIPITINLQADQAPARTFHFEVANDQLFTPLMAYAAIYNTLGSYERQFGATTFAIKGEATIKNHAPVSFDDLFSTGRSAMDASAYIVAPLTYLLGNDREQVEIGGLTLSIRSAERPETATLERVWLDDPRPRAGQTVPLKMVLRTYRGEELVKTVPIAIPANASRGPFDSGDRRRTARTGRTAADPGAAADASGRPGHRVTQPRAPQRHAVRQAARVGGGSRRGRRAAAVAAAVGDGGARGGPERRELQSAPQRHPRRVGGADRSGGQRDAHADDHRAAELGRRLRRDTTLMHTTRARAFAAAVILALTLAPLLASSPRFFQTDSQAEFLKGEVTNLSIDTTGRVALAPSTDLVYETTAPFVWSILSQVDGTLFVAPATRARCIASTRAAPARCSSTAASSKSTPWRPPRTADSTWPPRRTARSTRSIATGPPRPFSIPPTSTSGPSPSTARATSTPGPARKAWSTRSRRTGRARRSTRPRRHT